MIFITTWKSEDSDTDVSSASTEHEYIVELCTDDFSSACIENSISPEIISPTLTGQATIRSAKALQRRTSFQKEGSVSQGETEYVSVPVESNTKYVLVILKWGNKNNSLTLGGKTSSGRNLSTRSDSSDNTIDAQISTKISPKNGEYVEQGTWMFKVYGKKVNGTEDFTFYAYKNKA